MEVLQNKLQSLCTGRRLCRTCTYDEKKRKDRSGRRKLNYLMTKERNQRI